MTENQGYDLLMEVVQLARADKSYKAELKQLEEFLDGGDSENIGVRVLVNQLARNLMQISEGR